MTTQTEANASPKDAALKLALEALEMVKANADDWQERTGKEIKGWMQPVNNSITAIKESLAQPEEQQSCDKQEPVTTLFGSLPVYDTTPPQRTWERPWVSLTDEEKQEWIDAMPYDPQPRHCMTLVNIIEAKLKEKNT